MSRAPTAAAARPRMGNRTKVEARTVRCSRQWPMPCSTASRDSLAPCRKNSSTMAALVMTPNTTAPGPRAGSTLARITDVTRATMNGSGMKRLRFNATAQLPR